MREETIVEMALRDTTALMYFLQGAPPSRPISLAITKIEEAMHWLEDAQRREQEAVRSAASPPRNEQAVS